MQIQKIQRSTFLKEIIDTTSKITGLSIVIQNPQDFPKTDEELRLDDYYTGHWSPFCTLIKACPAEVKICGVYEQEKAKKARTTKVPFFAKCRFGVADVHIPILDEEEFLGSIVCGQVFMEKPGESGFRKLLKKLQKNSTVNPQKLRQIYFKSPYVTPEKLDDIVNRMDLLSRYIVETHEKNRVLRMLRKHYAPELDASAKSREEAIVKKAIGFIEANYDKDISRDDVSRNVYLNPSYFSRMFHKVTGKTFSDYLIETRLEKAKLLMQNPLLTTKEIAYQTGFDNPYYFSRLFKQKEGAPPRSYRSSLK